MHVGILKYQESESKCNDLGAQLPIPRSDKELDDLYVTLSAFELTRTEVN